VGPARSHRYVPVCRVRGCGDACDGGGLRTSTAGCVCLGCGNSTASYVVHIQSCQLSTSVIRSANPCEMWYFLRFLDIENPEIQGFLLRTAYEKALGLQFGVTKVSDSDRNRRHSTQPQTAIHELGVQNDHLYPCILERRYPESGPQCLIAGRSNSAVP
jgi:hypothetical protein